MKMSIGDAILCLLAFAAMLFFLASAIQIDHINHNDSNGKTSFSVYDTND